jgi:hypothetical protein
LIAVLLPTYDGSINLVAQIGNQVRLVHRVLHRFSAYRLLHGYPGRGS